MYPAPYYSAVLLLGQVRGGNDDAEKVSLAILVLDRRQLEGLLHVLRALGQVTVIAEAIDALTYYPESPSFWPCILPE